MDNEYSQKQSILFTPASIGPITLRNRTIRSAAFEGMCDHNAPTEMLYDYHRSVAAGGIGMTTLAYASVTRNGLSFNINYGCDPKSSNRCDALQMPFTTREPKRLFNWDIAAICRTAAQPARFPYRHRPDSTSIPPHL